MCKYKKPFVIKISNIDNSACHTLRSFQSTWNILIHRIFSINPWSQRCQHRQSYFHRWTDAEELVQIHPGRKSGAGVWTWLVQPGVSTLNCEALPPPYNVAEGVVLWAGQESSPSLTSVGLLRAEVRWSERSPLPCECTHTRSCRFLPGPRVTPFWLSVSISERAAVPQTHTEQLLPAVAHPQTYSFHCIVQQFSNKALIQLFLDRQPLLYWRWKGWCGHFCVS